MRMLTTDTLCDDECRLNSLSKITSLTFIMSHFICLCLVYPFCMGQKAHTGCRKLAFVVSGERDSGKKGKGNLQKY